MTNTTLKKTFAVAVLAAAAALVATPAQAQPATQPRVVEVTANADGLVAPGVATLRPGATTFRVTTPDSDSRYVAVVGLRPGVLHEAVYIPVRPGTTDADIDRAFAGQGPSPFIGAPQGVLPIVGNQAVVLHLDLAPGRYAITSWVGHPETGAPDVARGMRKVIDVVG